jgi:uncharacterized protein YndB with AHSA1/START domain
MAGDDKVELTIRIAARPATVFRYFSDPNRFTQWMGARSHIAPEPKGAVVVTYPNGDVAVGRITELVLDRRIVLTWGYEDERHGLPAGTSQVIVELEPIETGTLVRLTHSGLNREQQREHSLGWRYYLGALAIAASREEIGSISEERVADYIAAWAECDPATRMRLLERSWHSDGVFRDAVGVAEGRAALNDYIETAQQLAPAMRLERTGPIRHVHGHICYSWRIAAPNGLTAMTGHNFCEFAADGSLRTVVGFWDDAPAAVAR